jgi:hypothetical protein
MKIKILEGYDGFERSVNGTVDLDGNNVYKFELDTYDGMTSIYLIDGYIRINLEDEDECDRYIIEDGIEIYDEILDFVNNEGYDFIGVDFA